MKMEEYEIYCIEKSFTIHWLDRVELIKCFLDENVSALL